MTVVLYFLLVSVFFLLIILFLSMYLRQVIGAALTEPFRAAEAIANGYFPKSWIKKIQSETTLRESLRLFLPVKAEYELAIDNIDRLIQFFSQPKFFDSQETQNILLTTLKHTRSQWAGKSFAQILEDYPIDDMGKPNREQESY